MSRGPIFDIANRFLNKVRPQGQGNLMAACPFHRSRFGGEERNPSFSMSTETGAWLCFACHESGNLRMFLEKMGLTGKVAETTFGVLLDELDKLEPVKKDPLRPELMEEIPEGVLGLLHYCPEELLDAGFTMPTLEYFEVGFDHTHERITFPIRDLWGRLIGINGRATGVWGSRYKVYGDEFEDFGLPKMAPPDNHKVLWNAHRIYDEVFKDRDARVILVEGYKACMWVHQSGFPHVVASQGSSLSAEQCFTLEHLGATIYVFYDNDRAGIQGTIKVGRRLARTTRVHVVQYPLEFGQPDQLSPDHIATYISNAPTYAAWKARKEDKCRLDAIEKRSPE